MRLLPLDLFGPLFVHYSPFGALLLPAANTHFEEDGPQAFDLIF